MLTFKYKAVDKIGRPARGNLDAANEIDLELRLRRMGLDLITFREIDQAHGFLFFSKITRQDLITFCFHMEQVGRAGIPLLEGLAALRDTTENLQFREVLASVYEDMEGGKVLSQALATHPQLFSALFSSLIKAGEQTGRLTEVFESLGATLKWQDELLAQAKRFMLYPAMVLVVIIAVIFFLMLYLVPQLVTFLKNLGEALPLQTKIMIFLSGIFVNYWYLMVSLPIVAVVAAAILVRKNDQVKYFVDYMKLESPVVGPIVKKIILARFANYFALMYQSGITILDAVKISEDLVDNRVIADGLRRAGQQINAGDSLTESFTNLGLFPPLVLRMLKIGETTGALDKALYNISYFYSREVKDAMDKGLKLLEPTLITILGLILALIMFSVLSPIYDTLGKLKF